MGDDIVSDGDHTLSFADALRRTKKSCYARLYDLSLSSGLEGSWVMNYVSMYKDIRRNDADVCVCVRVCVCEQLYTHSLNKIIQT